jgi:hypothetical protein
MYRMVTLDRLAECCHNSADVKGANAYYKEALDLYETYRNDSISEIDKEACGIWFNYGMRFVSNYFDH